MQILIVKDGGATKVPREVADQAAVDALTAQGFEVEIVSGGEEAEAEAEAAAPARKTAKKAKA